MKKEFFEDAAFAVMLFIGGILLLFLLAIAQPAQAQERNYERIGNTFKYETTRSVKRDTLLTTLAFEDSKGNKYPIIVTRKSGRCYVWRKSQRSGRMYRYYLHADISKAVCKQFNLRYIEK